MNFNASHLFATPSFYVQQMLRDTLGTHVLATTVGGGNIATQGGAGLWSAQASAFSSSSAISLSSVVVKLVNYASAAQPVNITLSGLRSRQKVTTVRADVLTHANPLAENSLDDPQNVQPCSMPIDELRQVAGHKLCSPSIVSELDCSLLSGGFQMRLPPWSLVIATLTIGTNGAIES